MHESRAAQGWHRQVRPPGGSDEVPLSGRLSALLSRPVGTADRARAALHVLDWLGCALIGATQPAGRMLVAWAAEQGASGPASAIGHGSATAETAAFVNGGLGNILEMDDLHRESLLHAGDVVVPAALAAAEAAQARGADLLAAVVLGYEAAIRIGMAAASSGYSVWYNTGTCGVFGAAVAAAHARGAHGGEILLDALGQAGMQAAGIWQCRLEATDSKQLASAHAARAGVCAAAVAAAGFRGARGILEGDLGFFRAYYPEADPLCVTAAPDAPWRIHEVSFKPWPACRHTHPAIAAALRLRGRVTVAEIDRIEVHSYAAGVAFCDDPAPESDHAARFSLQHCVAVALLRGAPGLTDFGAAARRDTEIAALCRRFEVREAADLTAAFPGRMGAHVVIARTGASLLRESVTTAPGDPEDPLTEAQILAKFNANAVAAGLDVAAAEQLQEAVLALPAAPGPSLLQAALSAASHRIRTAIPEPENA